MRQVVVRPAAPSIVRPPPSCLSFLYPPWTALSLLGFGECEMERERERERDGPRGTYKRYCDLPDPTKGILSGLEVRDVLPLIFWMLAASNSTRLHR